MTRPTRLAKTAILLLCCLSLPAGCGAAGQSSTTSSSATAGSGSSSTSSAPGPSSAHSAQRPAKAGEKAITNLYLEANRGGELRYNKTSLRAKAGRITIHFTNESPMLHDVVVQSGTSGPTLGAIPGFIGGTRTLTLNLKPGKYTYYCSVPGHRAAGMLGTLTVY